MESRQDAGAGEGGAARPAAPRALRCDLHLHTRYSAWKHLRVIRARDSYSDPEAVYERALAAGMDYVAFTDHDSIDGALHLLAARPDAASRVIIGEEVETWFPDTGQWAHVKRPRAYVEEILGLFDHFEIGNGAVPLGHREAGEAMLRYAGELLGRKTGEAGRRP